MQKLKECVYCGRTEKLTKDHIPPKNLFAKPRPNNLITVPSCEPCNKGFQLDDDYFQMIMHTQVGTGGHTELNRTKAKFIAALNRKESAKFKRRIINSIFTAELITKSGIYVGKAPALQVDGARINKVGSRIVKGLFYHEKGYRLADSYEAIAYADPLNHNDDPEVVGRLVAHMLTKPEKIIGNNVFSYRFYFHEEDQYTSAWLMVFYENMIFLGETSLREDVEGSNQRPT